MLATTAGVRLASGTMFDLYEQIVIEMCELREVETARALMRTTPVSQTQSTHPSYSAPALPPLSAHSSHCGVLSAQPLVQLRQEQPDRYLRLERLVSKPAFDRDAAYAPGSSREHRRQHIAETLRAQLATVPPSRLLALLAQSVKWQQLQGLLPNSAAIDLFAGTAAATSLTAASSASALTSPPTRNSRLIRLTPPTVCHALSFSPTGSYLLSGSSDGLLELLDPDTGRLSRALLWQERGEALRHDEGVLCAAFSSDGELVASGGRLGGLCVWRVNSAVCLRRWERAHADGVCSVAFVRDGSRVLSGAYDGSVKLHGLKSGALLREFVGHTAAVSAALWCGADDSAVVTASADGSVRRWDAQSGECVATLLASPVPVVGAALFPTGERLLVCGRTGPLRVLSLDNGAVVQELRVDEAAAGVAAGESAAQQWLTACVSASGLLVYGLSVDSVLHVWSVTDGGVVHMMRLHKSDAIALAPHPHVNVLASSGQDNTVKLWR